LQVVSNKYLYPVAFIANSLAMTALFVMLGLAGRSEHAAEVALVQGVTTALFFAFSGDARSVILRSSSSVSSRVLLRTRFWLSLPLGLASVALSIGLASVPLSVALILVLRRWGEWIVEIRLSEAELRQEHKFARRFLVVQGVLLGLTAAALIWQPPWSEVALAAWAASPLLFSFGHPRKRARDTLPSTGTVYEFAPHLGGTAVIGISVYVFRLMILLIVGRALAGDLYAAFAIGSILGTVFAQALGPTLAFHEAKSGEAGLPAWLAWLLAVALLGGIATVVAVLRGGLLEWTGKSDFFWLATGLSVIGGVVMVGAQRLRVGLIYRGRGFDVFGPDVLSNLLIVAAVPYGYYLFGKGALAALYLLGSLTALAFYASAYLRVPVTGAKRLGDAVRRGIGLLLVLPLFFQLAGTIFRDPSFSFAVAGRLTQLPIPVSVLACLPGLVLLGNFGRARASLSVLFLTFVLMISASLLAPREGAAQEAKLILLIQFLLPMLALVLGQAFSARDDDDLLFIKSALCVLAAVVPMQIAATWLQGHSVLSPYLYAFSIYQHLQYVPVMFAALYLLGAYALWSEPSYRSLLLALAAPMGVYVSASGSLPAIGVLTGGFLVFLAYARSRLPAEAKSIMVGTALILASSIGYLPIVATSGTFPGKFERIDVTPAPLRATKTFGLGGSSPVQAAEAQTFEQAASRAEDWRRYATAIADSVGSFTLGHPTPLDRSMYARGHNYPLDFVYSFGVISLLPLLGLAAWTVLLLYRHRDQVIASPPLLGLAFVAGFLVLVDNSLKVGMRQPYPGILTFFLWGLLLHRLGELSNPDRRRSDAATPSRG